MYFSSRHEKNAEVDVLRKKFTREGFTDPLKCSFNKPAPTFPARFPLTLGSSRTKTPVKQVSQKVLWPESANWTPKKQKILHGPAKVLPPKNRTKVLNQFFEKKLHWRRSLDMQNGSLTNLRKKSRKISEKISLSVSKEMFD